MPIRPIRTKSNSFSEIPVRIMISAASINSGSAMRVKELIPENMRIGIDVRLLGVVIRI